jgi:hypothetical protein
MIAFRKGFDPDDDHKKIDESLKKLLEALSEVDEDLPYLDPKEYFNVDIPEIINIIYNSLYKEKNSLLNLIITKDENNSLNLLIDKME